MLVGFNGSGVANLDSQLIINSNDCKRFNTPSDGSNNDVCLNVLNITFSDRVMFCNTSSQV